MTFKDHFSRLAAQYAEFRPKYPGALFELLARVAPSRTRAWDCACGSGQATLDLVDDALTALREALDIAS